VGRELTNLTWSWASLSPQRIVVIVPRVVIVVMVARVVMVVMVVIVVMVATIVIEVIAVIVLLAFSKDFKGFEPHAK